MDDHLSLNLLLNEASEMNSTLICLLSNYCMLRVACVFLAPSMSSGENLTQTQPSEFCSTKILSTWPFSWHTPLTYSLISMKKEGSFFRSTVVGSNKLMKTTQWDGFSCITESKGWTFLVY